MSSGAVSYHTTGGMNVTVMTERELEDAIHEAMIELPLDEPVGSVRFYAAGCRTEQLADTVADAFRMFMPDTTISVTSDLLGAARALCLDQAGIACILGTGSNCCEYSPELGGQLVATVPPLGYILGDEGSGAAIGKHFVAEAIKGLMDVDLAVKFFAFAGMTGDEIISAVYRGKNSNRFLARFARFAAENIGEPKVEQAVAEQLMRFFSRNVLQLPHCKELPLNFTGSIAATFRGIIERICDELGLRCGVFVDRPIERLVTYHTVINDSIF